MGYTTSDKTLIRNHNSKIMSEFKSEIISRCRTLIPVTFLWIKFASNGTDGGLHFRFWILISALVVSEKMKPKNLQVFKFIIHLEIPNTIVVFGM